MLSSVFCEAFIYKRAFIIAMCCCIISICNFSQFYLRLNEVSVPFEDFEMRHRAHDSINVTCKFEARSFRTIIRFREIEFQRARLAGSTFAKGTVISLPRQGSSLFNPCLQQSLNKKKKNY